MNITEDASELISEHERLVQVLRSTSHDDDRREAKKQAAELKTLRQKKAREGLPAKPAPEPYPGVEPGDSLYIHHPKRGPLAVKVHAQGRHGITATDNEGNWHRAKWQHVLGAKQRLSQRLTLVDQGEDGAITEDEAGQRRYVAIDPEARENQEPMRKSQPTAAQTEAGNYRKEHLRFQGLDISIENPKGSVRTGTGPSGKPWHVTMHHAYGYIRGTCGVDKDHVDCYVGPNPDASHAYVIHQRQAGKWDRYDEDKVMLGFDSAADAKAAYLAQYNDPRFFGTMTALPMADFKRKALATRNRPQMIKGQVLFFKAVKTKSAHQGGLFEQIGPVKGYVKKDGTPVAPHQAKHKHAVKKPKILIAASGDLFAAAGENQKLPRQLPKTLRGGTPAELSSAAHTVAATTPVLLQPIEGLAFSNAEKKAITRQTYERFKHQPITNASAGFEINVTHGGLKHNKAYSADVRKIVMLEKLDQVLSQAIFIRSEAPDQRKENDQNLKAYHKLAMPLKFGKEWAIAKITVQQDQNGKVFYDSEMGDVEWSAPVDVSSGLGARAEANQHPDIQQALVNSTLKLFSVQAPKLYHKDAPHASAL